MQGGAGRRTLAGGTTHSLTGLRDIREGEAPAEPKRFRKVRLGGSLALPLERKPVGNSGSAGASPASPSLLIRVRDDAPVHVFQVTTAADAGGVFGGV